MRYSLIVLVVTFGLRNPTSPQSVLAATEQTAAIEFVQKAAPRALDYVQGNRESLMDAEEDFTPDGWREFMKWLAGFLDDKGAPTGSARFTATGATVVKSKGNDAIRLAIPAMPLRPSGQGSGLRSGMPLPTCFFSAYSSIWWPVGAGNRTRSPVALCSPAGMLSTLQPKPETALASSSKVALLSTLNP